MRPIGERRRLITKYKCAIFNTLCCGAPYFTEIALDIAGRRKRARKYHRLLTARPRRVAYSLSRIASIEAVRNRPEVSTSHRRAGEHEA